MDKIVLLGSGKYSHASVIRIYDTARRKLRTQNLQKNISMFKRSARVSMLIMCTIVSVHTLNNNHINLYFLLYSVATCRAFVTNLLRLRSTNYDDCQSVRLFTHHSFIIVYNYFHFVRLII